jgi:hypothetical protein
MILQYNKKLVNRSTILLRIQHSISIVDLSSRVVIREVTPRAVHSLWNNNNINACHLRVVIGMRYSPPLKRHVSLGEYWHVIPNGQTWPQQQLAPFRHLRSRRCHHDQWIHSIIKKTATDYCSGTSTESAVHRWRASPTVRLSNHNHGSSGSDPDLWPLSVIS